MDNKLNLLLILLVAVLLTGRGVKDGDLDNHYKPSEFKHNVAISNANRAVDDIEREIISFGTETSVDILMETYNGGIATLNNELKNLEETKAKLKDDTDLTSSELKRWELDYTNTIVNVNNMIKDIERRKQKLYE